MTARKPRNRTQAAGKAAKTIDLTAEDVTDKPTSDEMSKAADEASSEKTVAKADEKAAAETPPEASSSKEADKTKPDAAEEPSADKDAPDAKADTKAEDKTDAKPSDKSEKTPKDESVKEDKAEKSSSSSVPKMPKATPAAPAVPPAAQPKQGGGFGGGLIGGLLGGVAVVALCYFGLQQGMIPMPTSKAAKQAEAQVQTLTGDLQALKDTVAGQEKVDLAPFDQRIAALEAEIGKVSETLSLATAPVPAEGGATEGEPAPRVDLAPINYALAGLTAKLEELTSKLEEVTTQATTLSESQDGLTQRVAGLEGLHAQFVEAKKQIAELETVTKAQAARIEQKATETIAKVEEDLGSAKEEILSNTDRRINDVVVDLNKLDENVTTKTQDLAGRVTSLEENNVSEQMQSSARTIALAGLENAVASGDEYQVALATFTDVVGSNPALEVLAAHAESGAPTKEKLAADFDAVYDKVLKEAEDAGAGTLLDKFLLNAQNLVKVRSLSGEKKGKSLTSLLGVIEYHVKEGNLEKAAAEWEALPEAARDAKAGAAWVKGLKARIAVDAAMETIRSDFGDLANKNDG
nr:hypothetical protein [uncultured Cohaesibacter sp.]